MTREQTLELENLDLQIQLTKTTIKFLNLQGLELQRKLAAKEAEFKAAEEEPKVPTS